MLHAFVANKLLQLLSRFPRMDSGVTFSIFLSRVFSRPAAAYVRRLSQCSGNWANQLTNGCPRH